MERFVLSVPSSDHLIDTLVDTRFQLPLPPTSAPIPYHHLPVPHSHFLTYLRNLPRHEVITSSLESCQLLKRNQTKKSRSVIRTDGDDNDENDDDDHDDYNNDNKSDNSYDSF